MFFSQGICWEPFLPKSKARRPILPTQLSALDIDIGLENVWADLHVFCISANVAFQTDQKINPEIFQDILISIEYRLLLLDLGKDGFLETLRLGILAFSTTVFLQTQGIKARFNNLSRQLQVSISRLEIFDDSLDEAWLWILFVTAVSTVTNEDDYWLMPLLKAALLKTGKVTWEEVQDMLKSFMWIDVLHDKDGKRVFDQVVLQ